MGNSQSKLKCIYNKLKVVKRIIKCLSVALDLHIVRAVITKALNAVIGAISNRALNCRQGAVHIPPHLIPLFRHYNQHFDYLVFRRNQLHPSDIWFIRRVMLFLLLHHCWQQFLAQSVKNLHLGLCAKMTSSFSKKVLIEQAELDRLKQRQLREHSPKLQAMVRILNNMRDITANKKLIAKEWLNLISGLQI